MVPASSHSFLIQNAWLIPAMAFATFLVVGLIARPLSEWVAGLTATIGAFLTLFLTLATAYAYFQLGIREPLLSSGMEWLRFQPGLSVNIGVLLDPISVLLMVVVTTVSSLVHLYSLSYMDGEKGYGRYFTFLGLFTFSMLGLVLAPNILQMFVCWELVGASSFLLIGFYYDRPAAAAAAKKAFIVTRFADLGFLLGVLLLGYFSYGIYMGMLHTGIVPAAQPFDFLFLNSPPVLQQFMNLPAIAGVGMLSLAMLLLFAGAAGKSAMFPLHIWLPDAMEGPTPVSALIHAATMVVAGVYLVARMFPGFAAAETPLLVVATVGATTCLFGALIACVQDDIKRVLAYSTLSQLGYMMFALGTASLDSPMGYAASMFHLFTHAFFKALLFLGAGAIIHAVHTNDIRKMGGLAARMPWTHAAVLIASLSIAGVWPLSGFFSKDLILAAAFESQHFVVYAVGMLVAGLTAFYMFRMYFLTFWGAARSHGSSRAHEAPLLMLIPLGVLAGLSLVTGFAPVPAFVAPHYEHGSVLFTVALPASAMALIGIGTAWFFHAGPGHEKSPLAGFGRVLNVVRHKFYIDEIYAFIVHKVIFRWVATPIAWFDRNAVDGSVNVTGNATRGLGAALSKLQTGQLQTYAMWFAGGAVVMVLLVWSAFLG